MERREIKEFTKIAFRGRKNHIACSSCGVPIYEAIDNIDDYAEELLRKIENNI